MTLNTFDRVSIGIERKTFSSEGNALIHFYIIADNGSFANYHSGTMIDGKEIANSSARMNIDSGFGMRHFGNDTRDKRHIEFQQRIGYAVVADSANTWITKNHFAETFSCGVAIEGSQHISMQFFAYGGKLTNKLRGLIVGLVIHQTTRFIFLARFETHTGLYLVRKQGMQFLHIHANMVKHCAGVYICISEVTRKKN